MKIINAVWEKRNLNMAAKEILLSKNDSISDIDIIINSLSCEKQYIVAKIPVGRTDLIKYFTEKGYLFVESLLEISLYISEFKMPHIFKKYDDLLEYRKMLIDDDFLRLENEIRKGIFKTDRIALDANFGIDIAATRYTNWLRDEIQNESEVFEIIYKKSPIGFFTLKKISDGTYDNFLAGMYSNGVNTGFGFSILSKPIIELNNRKAKIYNTHISSNNIPIMRLYISFGFLPIDIVYVMTKVSNG